MTRVRKYNPPSNVTTVQCRCCKKFHIATDFYWTNDGKLVSRRCRLCINAYGRWWREQNREVALETNRKWREQEKLSGRARDRWFKHEYGITLAEYDRMVAAQNGLCKICNKEETTKDKRVTVRRLCVDHDHVTGKVRALLCSKCNRGLGHYDHDVRLLDAARNYLSEHE